MTDAERAELRQHLTKLTWQHIGFKRQQHALLDVMERLADPSPFFPDLALLTESADRLMAHIEAGWELLRDEADSSPTGSQSLH